MDVWGLPRILGSETVWVRRPQSKELVEIPNPLYRFRFPDGEIISAKKREPVMFSKDMNIVSFRCHHQANRSLSTCIVAEGSSLHNSQPWSRRRIQHLRT